MIIIRTVDFDSSLNKLPRGIKALYEKQEEIFKKYWRDSRLHIKKIRSLESAYSLRITRRYRAFFYFHTTDAAVFFEIDHRKDVYR